MIFQSLFRLYLENKNRYFFNTLFQTAKEKDQEDEERKRDKHKKQGR